MPSKSIPFVKDYCGSEYISIKRNYQMRKFPECFLIGEDWDGFEI